MTVNFFAPKSAQLLFTFKFCILSCLYRRNYIKLSPTAHTHIILVVYVSLFTYESYLRGRLLGHSIHLLVFIIYMHSVNAMVLCFSFQLDSR